MVMEEHNALPPSTLDIVRDSSSKAQTTQVPHILLTLSTDQQPGNRIVFLLLQ